MAFGREMDGAGSGHLFEYLEEGGGTDEPTILEPKFLREMRVLLPASG